MTGVLITLAAIIVGWFAAGSICNVRKGHAALRWMKGGLPQLGERTTLRWLGTTAVELTIAKPKRPFERVSLVVFLEPRDVPWLWLPSRRRGRRDTLILRAQLASTPKTEVVLLDRVSWSGRGELRRIRDQRWSVREPSGTDRLTAFAKFEGSLNLADDIMASAAHAGVRTRLLAVRPTVPHLEMHVDLPDAEASAPDFFASVGAIGERASRS
jgi:hypothetical protein